MRLLSSTAMLAAAGLALFTAGSLAVAPDANAQGVSSGNVRIPEGNCPRDWRIGEAKGYCQPMRTSSPPAIYVRTSKNVGCAAGYYVDHYNALVCTTRAPDPSREQTMGKGGKFAKPNPLVRCPTGWISTDSYTECYTQLENAPIVRAKGAEACAAGELDDWGLWCTSNYAHLTTAWAERYGIEDFNRIYAYALGNRLDANAIPGGSMSPAASAYFKGTTSATGASAATSTSSSQPAENKAAECTSASELGAAVGGGRAGRPQGRGHRRCAGRAWQEEKERLLNRRRRCPGPNALCQGMGCSRRRC
ncbi:MAG: hypothetical protein HC843_11710 [Sphingomonadales bacterium]|nr:hypothetical protein [Sphingomonadales bacterium]